MKRSKMHQVKKQATNQLQGYFVANIHIVAVASCRYILIIIVVRRKQVATRDRLMQSPFH
jgi:hypothetical protein